MSGQWVIRPDAIGAMPHERDMWCVNYGCRPLVVIDPEDREQIDRLAMALADTYEDDYAPYESDHMQAALRSLIEPPKPDEPTNPAARVTDRRENIWRLLADGDWVCTSGPDIGEYLAWSHLTQRGPLSIEAAS